MTATQTSPVKIASVGDDGALNVELKPSLSEVWIDRDMSWLDFNDRVLAQAEDLSIPLLERAKFLAIFTSNLDEFFMKRVAVLRQYITPDNAALFDEIKLKLLPSLKRQSDCFRNEIVPALEQQGISLRHWEALSDAQKAEACAYFDAQISPALTPLVIESADHFPFLSNLSTSLVFLLTDEASGEITYGRVKVPADLRHWIHLQKDEKPGEHVFVRLNEVIRENLHKLYAGMKIGQSALVRLTRDAEVESASIAKDVVEQVREQVKKRRFEPVVRLEFTPGADEELREMLRKHFQLTPEALFDVSEELDYTTLFELLGLRIPGLVDKPWTPVAPAALREGHADIFGAIRAGDILVHHPYESFDASVEKFVAAASADPQVVAVKMTVYRVGDDTPFVGSLIRAAEAGKQVACVIELNARFDEERNLHWAAAMEKAGAHVVYGAKGLKVHAKTALVIRKEADGLRAYAHVGTGNYHVKTARLYVDFGLLTCDPRITQDVIELFHNLTGRAHGPVCTTVLVAPTSMRNRFLEMIKREIEHKAAGRPARIVGKMNQLEDPELIEALCEASRAGVPIDLIIRGFCCLKPGVPGHTENIRVRSIIGRFLEHSRIYHFANGQERMADGEFYIGSADWMYRNLSKRVEVITPVFAAGPRQRLAEVLEVCLADTRQAWILGSDGTYARPAGSEHSQSLGTHQQLMDLAARSAG